MAKPPPDLGWYSAQSKALGLTPRCPFATTNRCPRFYQSLSLLGNAGSTEIPEDQDAKLLAFWRTSELWPLTAEQSTSVHGPVDGPKSFTKLCPEIAYLRFRLFASQLTAYADAEHRETTQMMLSQSGKEEMEDWRWDWWRIQPEHYSTCDLYSPLQHQMPRSTEQAKEEELLEMKPSVGGFSINLKSLLTRLAKWWLRTQRKP